MNIKAPAVVPSDLYNRTCGEKGRRAYFAEVGAQFLSKVDGVYFVRAEADALKAIAAAGFDVAPHVGPADPKLTGAYLGRIASRASTHRVARPAAGFQIL